MNKMYTSEQELVDRFVLSIDQNLSPWDVIDINTEFNYARGRTDIVFMNSDGTLIAVEAKLEKWKYAIHQAYRNRCYANQSYVLLPHDVAIQVCTYRHELDLRGVGVCSIEEDTISILYEAPIDIPLQPWLYDEAIKFIAR